jgi:hypothetical protein
MSFLFDISKVILNIKLKLKQNILSKMLTSKVIGIQRLRKMLETDFSLP